VITVLICTVLIRKKNSSLKKNNLKVLEMEDSLIKTQLEMKEKEKCAGMKLDEIQRKLAEIIEKEKCVKMEMEKINRELSETKDAFAKKQSKLDEKEKIANLYLEISQGIYKNVEQLPHDPSFYRIMKTNREKADAVAGENAELKNQIYNKDKEMTDSIVKCLASILYKGNTWEKFYNTGKSTFDKIKILHPELTLNEFKIVCFDCLGYTNTMIARITGLKQTTIAQQKTYIRQKLNIDGDIGSYIIKKIDSN
jgi:hypothetical protein